MAQETLDDKIRALTMRIVDALAFDVGTVPVAAVAMACLNVAVKTMQVSSNLTTMEAMDAFIDLVLATRKAEQDKHGN